MIFDVGSRLISGTRGHTKMAENLTYLEQFEFELRTNASAVSPLVSLSQIASKEIANTGVHVWSNTNNIRNVRKETL